MFTAFFVLALVSKKQNRSRFICPISCPFVKLENGTQKIRKDQITGKLKSENGKYYLEIIS